MDKLKCLVSSIIEKPEKLFLILGIFFGLFFMILTPKYMVQDEGGHLHRATEIANGHFYNKVHPKVSKLDTYFKPNLKIGDEFPDEFGLFFHSGYSPLMYISSAIGLKLSEFSHNANIIFYTARLLNLFAWLAMIYFAIRLTPVFKWFFMLFALLPMSIFEGMSLSADSFVNAFCFLFFAYMFKLIYSDNKNSIKLSGKEIFIYAIFTLISAQLKGCLIYPALLIFLTKDKRKYLIGLGTIVLAVLLGALWVGINSGNVAIGVFAEPDINKEFLLTHPLTVLYYCAKTTITLFPNWLKDMIAIFGGCEARLNSWCYALTLIVYSISFMKIQPEQKISTSHKLFVCPLIIIYFLSVLTALFITWTAPNSEIIYGFQGRYITCILPLFFILFAKNTKPNNENFFKIFSATFLILLLIYSCFILNDTYLVLYKFYWKLLYWFYKPEFVSIIY